MKKTVCFLIFISILSGCNKEPGEVLYKISYTSDSTPSPIVQTKGLNIEDSKSEPDRHSQFGSFITSLTPDKFTARLLDMRFMNENSIAFEGYTLQMIGDFWTPDDPRRIADFSEGNTVSIVPLFWGGPNTGSDGRYGDTEVNFIYFSFSTDSFYQEVELPEQYKTIDLNQLNPFLNDPGNVKIENILKFIHVPFVEMLFQDGKVWPRTYAFGNTDITTYYNFNEWHPPVESPLSMFANLTAIWSHKYTPFIFNPPLPGETKTITTVVSFDTENLIQIYTGIDNIPYTSDDIIVYAPNYWERISVAVEIN